MNTLNECPCCSELLLRHARQGQLYWFCRRCHQEMPDLLSVMSSRGEKPVSSTREKLSNLLNLV
jgi:ribosomal protein L37AE/L43A